MVKTYSISEFLQEDKYDLKLIEKFINHIEKNQVVYSRIVMLLALFMKSQGIIYAESFDSTLNKGATQIIELLLTLAKYSFLGLGLKEILSTMIAGGTFKEATSSAAQYLLTYMLIKIYPSLFNMFSAINF